MNEGAAGHGLPATPAAEEIPAEFRAGVAVQFAALAAQARLVQEFALPDEVEPAPVFTP